MQQARLTQAFANASAALVRDSDPAGALAVLLAGCLDALESDAGAFLVQAHGRLEVLTASSHTAQELEMLQAHTEQGPCFEAQRTGKPVQATLAGDLAQRWPDLAAAMQARGMASVHAAPLRWHGTPLGAMGVFRAADRAFDAAEDDVAQAFADLAMLVVVHSEQLETPTVAARIERVLQDRVVVEQAKGAVAEREQVGPAEAYQLLLERAAGAGGLTQAAHRVLEQARRRP